MSRVFRNIAENFPCAMERNILRNRYFSLCASHSISPFTLAPTNTTTLIGPPEIYQQRQQQQQQPSVVVSLTDNVPNPNLGLTENGSPTFLSTGNPCLDFFFHVVPDTPPKTLIQRLRTSWNHDPLKTLKLVCNLRGVRGTGKSDRKRYYTAAIWMHENHPKTLASNVASLADFGYFKDLPEILLRLLEGKDARRRKGKFNRMLFNKSKEEKRVTRAHGVVNRFNLDPDFRLLHDKVSDLFADRLRLDLKMLSSGDMYKISLAAKWCPSLNSSFDRSTLLCEAIARKVFPREEYPEYEGVEEAHYAYRVRDRLRKEVLVPLRKALQLPELYMCANSWGSLPYNRVASVAMRIYKEKFLEHDAERFNEYLDKVKSGKAKIAAGALLPHQIIASLLDDEDVESNQVAELQWKRMVDDMSQKGKFNSCLAICDVSGSMYGTPLQVCIALGILLSELCEEPWKGNVITFSRNPKLQSVEGDTLKSKAEFVKEMEWGLNTNFQKVFDLLLKVAVNEKLRGDQMVKRLFVFSDMEFDVAHLGNAWETDYQAIKRKFEESGYGDFVPEIVFWNLRNSKATPVPANEPGVALVSGFSKNLMSMFLEQSGTLNPEKAAISPEDVMEAAISGEEYQKLVVVD